MGYLDTPDKKKRLQKALAGKTDAFGKPYYAGEIDGEIGPMSVTAIIRFRADHFLDHPTEPVVDNDLMRELGLLTIQDPIVVGAAKAKGIDLLFLLGLIGPISAILKGRTMTKDQIEGVVRTLVAALAAFLAGKGYFPQISPELLTAITTLIVGAWSLWSNRPKVIVPLGEKK